MKNNGQQTGATDKLVCRTEGWRTDGEMAGQGRARWQLQGNFK